MPELAPDLTVLADDAFDALRILLTSVAREQMADEERVRVSNWRAARTVLRATVESRP